MSDINTTGTIVFDLDGTLVDSVLDLVPCLNRTIASEALPPVSQASVGEIVGQGARKMIERAYALNGQEMDEAKSDRLLALFLADYEQHIADHTVFFEDCLNTLDTLGAEGWTFAVCTNKFEHMARKLLVELGECHRFSVIAGGDTFDVRKPHPGHVLQTIQNAGGSPQKSIMVGDSVNDIAAAKAAQVPVIAVDFGYTDVPVTELNPDITISHYSEFVSAVEQLV